MYSLSTNELLIYVNTENVMTSHDGRVSELAMVMYKAKYERRMYLLACILDRHINLCHLFSLVISYLDAQVSMSESRTGSEHVSVE